MSEVEPRGFPMMPIKSWWLLRQKFVSKIPAEVTSTYLASALSISKIAATNNILPTLRKVGIISSTGKTTPVATEWRDDAKYPAVCGTMLKQVYPQEIRDLASDEEADPDQVRSWFANHTSSGISAARKMAAFYLLLVNASPEKTASDKGQKPRAAARKPAGHTKPDISTERKKQFRSGGAGPGIHLNLQIHISPESSPDQIDRIFASIAEHLGSISQE